MTATDVRLIALGAFDTNLFKLRYTTTNANWNTLTDLEGATLTADFRVTLANVSDGVQVNAANPSGVPLDIVRCEWEIDGVQWRDNDLGAPYTTIAYVLGMFEPDVDFTTGLHTITCNVVYVDTGEVTHTETVTASFTTTGGTAGGATLSPSVVTAVGTVETAVTAADLIVHPAVVTANGTLPALSITTGTSSSFIAATLDAATTGFVGAGYVLGDLTASGGLTTTGNGQVIELLDIQGLLTINHNDVTVRYCRVQTPATVAHVIRVNSGVEGLLVENCELLQDVSLGGLGNGVSGNHGTNGSRNRVRRCDIRYTSDGFKGKGGWTFEQNFIHPEVQYPGAHNDGIQCRGNTQTQSMEFLDNKVIMGDEGGLWGNACVFVTSSDSVVSGDIVIRRNWLQGGGSCDGVEMEQKASAWTGMAIVEDNRIVEGWPVARPGPRAGTSFISLGIPGGVIQRSGNLRIDVDGNVLGTLD